MTQSIMAILLFLLVYASYLVLFCTVDNHVHPRMLPLVFGGIVGGTIAWFYSDSTVAIFSIFSLLALFISFFSSFAKTFQTLFVVILIEECVAGFIRCIFYIFNQAYHLSRSHFYEQAVSLCLYLIAYFVTKYVQRKQHNSVKSVTTARQWIVFVMAFCMTFAVVALSRFLDMTSNTTIKTIILIAMMLSYVSIGGVVLFYANTLGINRILQEHLQTEQLTNQMMSDYYNALLEKESDTRQFRHDINNHLLGLSEYISNNDMDGAASYLRSMQASFAQIESKVKLTGNSLVDAILNRYCNEFDTEDVICIKGYLPETLSVDPYHFNTIFVNLLQNAVEAVKSLKEVRAADIIVSFKETTHFLQFTITNRYAENVPKVYLQSAGSARHHGYGLKNAEKSLIAIRGEMDVVKEADIYRATVSIPVY